MHAPHTPDQSLPCVRVEPLASEWVDGTLAPDLRAAVDAHLDTCAACADLVADLAAIASDARALPRLEPTRDLWAGIATRIDAPVVTLDSRRVTPAPARRWWTQVAAAAALIAVTAGVTWRLTIDGARRDAARVAVAVPMVPAPDVAFSSTPATTPDSGPSLPTKPAVVAAGPARDRAASPRVRRVGATQLAARDTAGERAPDGLGSAARWRRAQQEAARRMGPRSAPVVAVALPPAAQAYDDEITAMRAIVRERRGTLDTTTVRVLERNLQIIDQAIAESRAALAQDPASGLLAEQLTRAMRRKLELLRTVADLPARTS